MVTSRIWFTAAQKAELWERWKNGQSAERSRLAQIAKTSRLFCQNSFLPKRRNRAKLGTSGI